MNEAEKKAKEKINGEYTQTIAIQLKWNTAKCFHNISNYA